MKRTITAGFLLMLFVFGSSFYSYAKPAYAEEVRVNAGVRLETEGPNGAVRTVSAQGEVPKPVKTVSEGRGTSTAEVKARVAAKMEVRAEKRFGKMADRYEATIDRLDNILLRLNSRITKMKAEGATTTMAEKFTATAALEITAARTSLVTLSTSAVIADSETATTTKTAKEAITAMKKASMEVTKHIVSARVNLEKAVASLRVGAGLKAEIKSQGKLEATSSASSN